MARTSGGEVVRVQLRLNLDRQLTQQLLDMNLDPVHDSTDWGHRPYEPVVVATANLTITLAPARCSVSAAGVPYSFGGFKYHYDYASAEVPAFWLLDRGSFEIGGDATNTTVFAQTVCTAPVVRLAAGTAWTSDCVMPDANPSTNYVNKRVTHMFP